MAVLRDRRQPVVERYVESVVFNPLTPTVGSWMSVRVPRCLKLQMTA